MTGDPKAAHGSRERVSAHRARLRAKGLKPVTVWVPDLSLPEVRAEIERQCRLIAEADARDGIYEWMEAVEDWPPDEDSMPDYRSPERDGR